MHHKKKSLQCSPWKFALILQALLAIIFIFNVQPRVHAQEKTSIISSNMEVFIDFDKTTSREDLEGYTTLMAEYDVIMKFNNLNYTEGFLTNITVEFIDKSNVSSGTVTKNNSAGIEPFRYIYNTKEGSRFTIPEAHAPVSPPSESKNITLQVFKTSGADSTTISNDPENIETSTVTVYGDLPSNVKFVDLNSLSPSRRKYVITNTNTQYYDAPLYIVDGKEMDEHFEMSSIDKDKIEIISVLKGAAAVEKYGDNAKGGAIEISTKKNTNIDMGGLVIITPTSTKKNLQEFQRKLKGSGIQTEFEKVKRNKEGLITNIKIIARHNNTEMIATFSEKEGIQKIFVGLINDQLVVSSNPSGKN